MEDAGPGAGIIFVILLFMDMFLYGFGSAIAELNEKEVERRAGEKDAKSIRLMEIIRHPNRYANTVQLTTTLINVIAGAVYLNLWIRFLERNLSRFAESKALSMGVSAGVIGIVFSVLASVISALALLYIFLTFGVLLPKRVAAKAPEKWAYACVGPATALIKMLAPFTGLVNATVTAILFVFGVRGDEDENDVTEEEIINMVQEGFEQGVLEDSEAEMISNIFTYGDKEAQDIMTHRSNVVAIDGSMHLKDAIDFMLAGTNSRYPVYEENIDHIIGVLHLKDAMRYHRRDDSSDGCIRDLEGLLREAYFVPQTKNIDELFEEMQSRKLQMAIVVDEYGQMDGLVAMEDILEEIVGNILDEYDEDTEYIEDKGNDEYVMEGKTPLEDLAERFGINFDGEEFETLNGFMIYRLDHIPEPGEEFDVDYQGYNFRILSVENKMVQSVLVTKLPEETGETDPKDGGRPKEQTKPSGENEQSALEESAK
ncbi:MAG: hemolysin family protein [Clostridium sp.]|nr:hemolysin family protein [Acetatifactor muris]MCM1527856.1 hemolysin family protein [Bacteroides sp.]MCM1563356.1 hemolysin family protein [Clostridium sp.]